MKTIHESRFQTINYYEDGHFFECIWKNTEQMFPEDYQEGLRKQVELVKEYKVKKELFNTKTFKFPITPDLQKWTDEEIYTVKYELGVRQFALVVTEEMIAQLSLEQVTEEGKAALFNPKFFTSAQEARDFLARKAV